MKEYLINSGNVSIIVVPDRKQYVLLEEAPEPTQLLRRFLDGEPIGYDALDPQWFELDPLESWHGFDGKEHRLGAELAESELIDRFVLKRFNFGSLVAMRDLGTGKVQVFKRDKLSVDRAGQ